MSALAYVGLGANLGDPAGQIRSAVADMAAFPDTRVVSTSSLYASAPVGVGPQPDFVNAVCALRTDLPPLELLQHLLALEACYGRTRPEPGAPRTLDLDLLLYGARRLDTRELTLPHPRMHERAFVLLPLAELAPALEIPGRGTVAQLLERCRGQRVTRLA